jgi:hypothetical protein
MIQRARLLEVSNCSVCAPAVTHRTQVGLLPVNMCHDAMVSAIYKKPPGPVADFLLGQHASFAQPVVTTSYSSSSAGLASRLTVAIGALADKTPKQMAVSTVADAITNPDVNIRTAGLTLAGIYECSIDITAWMKAGRTIDDLHYLGITSEDLITKLRFGRAEWLPDGDYSAIRTKLHMTFAQFLKHGFRGDLVEAMKTRIPAQVYMHLGCTAPELFRMAAMNANTLQYLSHISFSDLVDVMKLDAATVTALNPDDVFLSIMHWSAQDMADKLNLVYTTVSPLSN